MTTQSTTSQRPARRAMDQFVLRLPDGLRERVRQAASENHRSMNAEILMYIEQGLAPATQKGSSK